MLGNVIDCVAHALDFFGILIRNFDVELFLEPHDKFNGIQRVSTEVINEARVGRHFAFVYAELVDDYRFNSLFSGPFCHFSAPPKKFSESLLIMTDEPGMPKLTIKLSFFIVLKQPRLRREIEDPRRSISDTDC